ncbi:MAG: fibronectin type III domain-containing protein, partial [Bifidobacteriaceae bacterium]|nr:fibronectin type III domain-containing protein [Bifidobacteriaceae bacterium]
SDPDGDEIEVDQSFPIEVSEGTVYASGNTIRYQAPDHPTSVEIAFQVVDAEGLTATGVASIRVHESQGNNKQEPTPKAVSGRVFAGQTVRLSIPLTGIDVDGDGVILQGIDTAPQKGTIINQGPDWLEYQAEAGATGTDKFTYAVEDWVGLRATATITVGIAEVPQGENDVFTRVDQVSVRPNQVVELRVLANDIDMAGGELELCGELEVDGVEAEIQDRRVVVTTPDTTEVQGGTVQYTACNQSGGRAVGQVMVTIDPEAAFAPPKARDYVIAPKETIDQTSVTVHVMDTAENPSGPLTDLELTVEADPTVAFRNDDNTITVNLQRDPAIVFYKLTNTNPDAEGACTYAFISVPALGTFPPILRAKFEGKTIEVTAGETKTISMIEYVRVGPGKEPVLVDPQNGGYVSATHGVSERVDANTLTYTADRDYGGQASISFKVADGDLSEAKTRQAVLTLPIRVIPVDRVKPVFQPATLSVELGGQAEVDLLSFVTVLGEAPDPAKVQFAAPTPPGNGVTATLVGSRLMVAADAATARVGTASGVGITLVYDNGEAVTGTVPIMVTGSTKPPLTLAPVTGVVVTKGKPATVNVLQGAVNPVPNLGPLKLVGQATVAPDVATASSDASGNITLTLKDDYVGAITVSFTANDALDQANRQVQGSFVATAKGVPDAPSAPVAGAVVNPGEVTLTWNQPAANGDPITGYTVSWGGGSQNCPSVVCTITGLAMGQNYSFTVVAHNGVGDSLPSPASAPVLVEIKPGAPTGVTPVEGDGQVTLSWTAPSGNVTRYVVTVTGGGTTRTVETTGTSLTIPGLAPGVQYSFTVRAENQAGPSDTASPPVTALPYGKPGEPTGLAVSRSAAGTVALSWNPVDENGASVTFTVLDSSNNKVCTTTATSCSASLAPGETRTYHVVAHNAAGDVSGTQTASFTMWAQPGAPGNVTATASTETAPDQGTVALKWARPGTIPSSFGVIYHVYQNGEEITAVEGPTTTFTQTGLGYRDGGYAYQVVACIVFQGGQIPPQDATDLCSVGSQTVTAVVKTTPSVPGAPTCTFYSKPPDKSGLEASLNANRSTYNAGNGSGTYTADSWATFKTAFETANTVYNNPAATQAQVDSAKTALDNAASGLTLAPTETPTTDPPTTTPDPSEEPAAFSGTGSSTQGQVWDVAGSGAVAGLVRAARLLTWPSLGAQPVPSAAVVVAAWPAYSAGSLACAGGGYTDHPQNEFAIARPAGPSTWGGYNSNQKILYKVNNGPWSTDSMPATAGPYITGNTTITVTFKACAGSPKQVCSEEVTYTLQAP